MAKEFQWNEVLLLSNLMYVRSKPYQYKLCVGVVVDEVVVAVLYNGVGSYYD